MMKTLFRLLTIALLLSASPVSAAWICLHASGAEIGATGGCTAAYNTALGATYKTWNCADTGNETIFWNTTLPEDISDTMEWKNFRLQHILGTATTGSSCWQVSTMVVRDGQDNTSTTYSAEQAAGIGVPSGTNVKLLDFVAQSATPGLPDDITDATGAACSTTPSTCRLAPLRVRLRRLTSVCGGNATGTMGAVSLCLEY